MPRARSGAALSDYRRKRDFAATPEPRGEGTGPQQAPAPAFTVQRHAARRLHYDFRLELDGVLKSWAVPRGPSLDPGEKRLAVEVEDHPLEYGEFEGDIPEGQYGAGQVLLWDRGSWRCEEGDAAEALAKGRLKFSLHGFKLHGRWTLVRMASGERHADEATETELRRAQYNWLLIKEKDEAARRGAAAEIVERMPGSVKARVAAMTQAAALPAFVPPQLATPVVAPPEQEGWVFEIKYDGYRILARLAGGTARLFTRAGNDWTEKLPALAPQLARIGLDGSWLDGEIVVLDPDGIPDFQALQNAFEHRTAQARIGYWIFDAPWLSGHDLRALPLIERKRRLAEALERAPHDSDIHYSEHFSGEPGQVAAALEQACRLGLEGLIGKQADAPYRSERTRSWIKLKCRPRQEFVIGGYTDPRGGRAHFGALLLGLYEDGGSLRYVGRVGSGFDDAVLERLARKFAALESRAPPFADPPGEKDVHWVRPELVAEVGFGGWTRENLLRQASFLGLREDKPAASVGREAAEADAAGAGDEVALGSRDARIRGVKLTHPERIMWPDRGITKSDLAHYYENIAAWALPHLLRRPLNLLRCPDGSAAECFFQKHLGRQRPAGVLGFAWAESSGEVRDYAYVESIEAVIGLVQRGILEFHTWGSRLPDPAQPDRITLDLDPAPDVPWPRVVEGARLARTVFEELGLACFVKTTGGKGLHVVAPVAPGEGWPAIKAFAKAIALHLSRVLPDRFTANMAKNRRGGKIFVDYLRNGEGATAIANYSTRARPGAPVSTPLHWDELSDRLDPADWNLLTVPGRLAGLREDPWQGYDEAARAITAAMRRALRMADV